MLSQSRGEHKNSHSSSNQAAVAVDCLVVTALLLQPGFARPGQALVLMRSKAMRFIGRIETGHTRMVRISAAGWAK